MKTNTCLEVFGTLTKEETLNILEESIVSKSLVFEGTEPYPGYYHDLPKSETSYFIYLGVKLGYRWIEIMRAAKEVKKDLTVNFDVSKCIVKIGDQSFYTIRLKNFYDFSLISKIQESFAKHGIQYIETHNLRGKYNALLTSIKTFDLEKIEDGIYLDKNSSTHAYFEFPYTHWDQFKELTQKVKFNWSKSNFDSAIAAFFYEYEVVDLIRIYSKALDIEYIKECIKTYWNQKKML